MSGMNNKALKTHPCSFPLKSNNVPLGRLPQCSLEICISKQCNIKCSRLVDTYNRKQFWPSDHNELLSSNTISLPTHTYIKPCSPYIQTYCQIMHADRQTCIKASLSFGVVCFLQCSDHSKYFTANMDSWKSNF